VGEPGWRITETRREIGRRQGAGPGPARRCYPEDCPSAMWLAIDLTCDDVILESVAVRMRAPTPRSTAAQDLWILYLCPRLSCPVHPGRRRTKEQRRWNPSRQELSLARGPQPWPPRHTEIRHWPQSIEVWGGAALRQLFRLRRALPCLGTPSEPALREGWLALLACYRGCGRSI
jgi:hypothetical protein